MKKTVYVLECEDATELGGPMGSERTTHLWTRVFSSLAAAKKYVLNKEKIQKYIRPERFNMRARGISIGASKVVKTKSKQSSWKPSWKQNDDEYYYDVGNKIYTITPQVMDLGMQK
jgi:hypothetical protein